MRGRMIAFEGMDGAGKTTQIGLLRKVLRKEGYVVHVFGLNANKSFKALCRTMNADDALDARDTALMKASEITGRLEYLVKPLLERGAVVIWDKYLAGSLAADAARGVPDRDLATLRRGFPEPDRTFFFELRPEESLRRKRRAGGPRFLESGLDVALGGTVFEAHGRWERGEIDPATVDAHFLDFQGRVSAAYEHHLPARGVVRIRAGRTVEEVAEDVVAHTRAALALPGAAIPPAPGG